MSSKFQANAFKIALKVGLGLSLGFTIVEAVTNYVFLAIFVW